MVAMPENQRISVSDMLREYDSPNTRRAYMSVLKGYIRFIYPAFEKEITAKKRDLGVRNLPSEVTMEILDRFALRYIDSDRNLRDDLLSYKESIMEQAPKSKKLKLSAVNQFLKANGIAVSDRLMKHLLTFTESGAISEEDIPTNEDLKRVCEYLPVHGKALAMVLASSGMRGDEAVQLMIDDVDLDADPAKVKLRAGTTKTGKKRITFITPETVTAIKEWLTYRPQYLTTAGGRSAKYSREGRYDGVLFPFTASNFNKIWNIALNKVGLLKKDRRTGRVTMSPHKLRKFFRLRVGMHGRDEAECLMGHQTGMSAVYARFIGAEGEQRLAEVYKKAIPELLIYGRSVIEERADREVQSRLVANKTAIGVLADQIADLQAEKRRLAQELETTKTQLTNTEKSLGNQINQIEKLIARVHRNENEIDDLRHPDPKYTAKDNLFKREREGTS